MYCGIVVHGPRKGEYVQSGNAMWCTETVPTLPLNQPAPVQQQQMKLHTYDVRGGIRTGIWVPAEWSDADCVGYLNKAVYAFTQSELVDVATR